MGDGDDKAILREIRQCFEEEDFGRALPLCAKAPDSVVVQRCRAYALLQMSRWKDALEVCEKTGDAELIFEKAYCLYRLNRFQEALDALKSDDGDASRRMRLEAQVRYRMADYEACAKMYEDLYEEDREDFGLLVNAAASHISGDNARQAMNILKDEEELLESTYAVCFNLACAMVEEGKLDEAEEMLIKAKDICVQELKEDEEVPEDEQETLEDHEELAAIQVQRALVLQRKGSVDEASAIYQKWMKFKPGRQVDVTVLAVASNNFIGLRPSGKSLFDSLTRIKLASKESLEHKLTHKQTIQIAINKALLLLQAHRRTEAAKEMRKLAQKKQGSEQVAIAEAAIASADNKAKVCTDILTKHLKEHPESDTARLALSAHLAATGQNEKALEALVQLPIERRAQPRIIEAMVAIYTRQHKAAEAVAVLREAVKFWSTQDEDEQTLSEVLKVLAKLATKLKDHASRAEVYQMYLEKVDGGDTEALVCLVEALAFADLERAEQYAGRLQVPDYSHLDAEDLEQQPIPKVMAANKRKDGEDTAAEGEAQKPKKKRKRKNKLPKNYDPKATPDPERWLPKRERTETKKKMQKKQKNYLRCAQGADAPDDASSFKKGPSTAQVEAAKDTTSGRPRNQGRRKK